MIGTWKIEGEDQYEVWEASKSIELIQYKRISDNEIEVTVLGDKGKGFSYSQFKQTSK